jgi:hypothetical protein
MNYGATASPELGRHRKIDAFTMIPFRTPSEFTRATDFSKSSIEQRIEAGYQEAVEQQIWDPKWVSAVAVKVRVVVS